MIQSQVVDATFVKDIRAAASFLGPGALEVDRYQDEIFDIVRRRFYFGQRITQTSATGHPSRYIEQVKIPTAGFTDPRQIVPVPSQPERVERAVMLKAI